MLVGLKELLNQCKKNKTAIPAFNVYNLETILAVNQAANHLNSPVIFSFGESYLDDVPIDLIALNVRFLAEQSPQSMVLHLDHAKNLSTITRAIDCGFTSVMYDGSHLSIEENIKNTRAVVEIARDARVSVEGELGYMNPEDGSYYDEPGNPDHSQFTRPELALKYVTETGVDALAIAIGNAHGLYQGVPHLDFSVLAEIAALTDKPQVLHGCSGIPAEQIKKAINLGICKINVNTELALGAVESIRQSIKMSPEVNSLRYEKLIRQTKADLVLLIEKYLKLTSN
ncbi:class II fructose-bisphosphate aldolase [Acetobacterium wieringae]|uniref:Class II fructose-bisphosphate aldolase n=1 Tax=Acetobacterium wieringae TaxID=52694 RepID=A0A5D0WHA4_9FIRM|nr:class II fructose-bisphosphate aldolase [Acetobacterium wieringae]TYC82301.1 class II fructose-bisphosphate aldolase [Acetobacterium wieringae]